MCSVSIVTWPAACNFNLQYLMHIFLNGVMCVVCKTEKEISLQCASSLFGIMAASSLGRFPYLAQVMPLEGGFWCGWRERSGGWWMNKMERVMMIVGQSVHGQYSCQCTLLLFLSSVRRLDQCKREDSGQGCIREPRLASHHICTWCVHMPRIFNSFLFTGVECSSSASGYFVQSSVSTPGW